MNKKNLKIAIQKRGRLNLQSRAFLASLGIEAKPNGRKFIASCQKTGVDILFVRDDDIPEYVSRGIVDFGIVGKNVLAEKDFYLNTVRQFEFGACQMVIAVPANSQIKTAADLANKRVATCYPRLLAKYLKSKNISATLIELKGSVEIAPALNLADAICDLVQTGNTLKENGLTPIETIMESSAVLIESPFANPNKKKILDLI